MKINTRLRLNSWISLVVVLLMMLSLAWSFQEIDRAEQNKNLIEEMRNATFERVILRDDYLLHREERAGVQWVAKTETLRGMLKTASERFAAAQDKALLQDAQRNFDATVSGFTAVLEKDKQECRPADGKHAFVEAQSRLINQVFLKAYTLQDSIARLYESTERAGKNARNRGYFLIIFFVLGGGITIAVNSFLVARFTTRRLQALHEGVKIIGGGNLDHRIAEEGNDELTDLASESNQMAASLKESLTSTDNLNREITERKQIELERQKFFLLAESSSEFIGMCDLDMNPLYVNPAGRGMVGLPDMEAACRVKVQDYYFPEDQRFIAEDFFPRVLREGHGDVEIRLRHFQTGEPIWMFYYLFRVHDAGGTPIGWATVSRDITEHKAAEAEQRRLVEQIERDRRALVSTLEDQRRTEETLRESTRRIREAQEMAHLGFWNWNVKTGDVEWSDEVYKIFGLDPNTFKPHIDSILALSPWPEDHQRDKELINRAIETRNPGHYEQKFLRPDKSIGYYYSTFQGNYDENNDLISIVGTVLDITERKQAEEALCESEATVRKKLKAIVEPEGDISTLELSDIMDINIMQSMMEDFYQATGMLGAVLDLSGKVLVAFGWQDICTKFHRCHPDTLKNCLESDTALTRGVPPGTVRAYRCRNNMWDMVTPLMVGDRHVGNVFLGQFFYEGETPDVELFRAQARQYGFNETEYLAALARVPHFSRETAEAGLLFCAQLAGIVTTLSYNAIKQARMLAERERLREELITLNTELEVKVEQRTAALEVSNKELEAFSYSVSHDLRAPLRHISGYVDLLNNRFSEALPEKAGHYLNEVTDSAKQMGTLIDDLLQFSRTGRQELRQADMEMNAVVQEALEKLKADAEDRNISWTVADLPPVSGDYSLLKQVWINLLENAVKYTRYKDEAKIEVGCTREDDHSAFFVRDNGVGFDMQYVHKLFGVFQRLHSPAEFEGTGIGLANVQRIVHKHGGRVRAEGRPDEGAVFYFTIPEKNSAEGGKS